MTSAAQKIATFAARGADLPLSKQHRHAAYRALLDTYAVAIAGQADDAPKIARAYLRENGDSGKCLAWATGDCLSAESAAWLNGITAHVLDYDDVMTPMRGHVSVALVPALIALSQLVGADGRRYSTAYAVGFEVLAKIAKAMAIPHYAKGWHSTSALGVLGATAACGALLGLNDQQITNALGLAVAQAGGTRQNFGTMGKSFQAGQCGGAAVRSALLAQAGFTAAPDALDGMYGYMTLYANKEDLSSLLDSIGKQPIELESSGIDVKKYPCCYATHKSLDGILALRREHNLTLEQVRGVEITSSAHGLEALICSRPKTGLEGKFSMEYAMAAALMDGKIQLTTFNDSAVMRPAVQAFFPHVTKKETTGPVSPRWVTVKVSLANGGTLEKHVTVGRGDAGDPLTDEELIAKAEDCFSYVRCNWSAKEFAAKVFDLTDRSIDALLRGMHPQRESGRVRA